MSYWIRAVCTSDSRDVPPAVVAAGVAQRLTLVTYLLCPRDEDDPRGADVRIEPLPSSAEDGTLRWVLRLRTARGAASSASIEHWTGAKALEELNELKQGPVGSRVRDTLAHCVSTVGFRLLPQQVDTMMLPVTVSAAAFLADACAGLVHIEDLGWFAATPTELDPVKS